jgi:hypothetical protein
MIYDFFALLFRHFYCHLSLHLTLVIVGWHSVILVTIVAST